MQLHPYLNFDGKTAEAMTFYAEALGAELQIMRMGDSPMPVPAEHRDRVLHATVSTPTLRLMASDTMPGMHPAPTYGTGVHLSLNFTTDAEARAVWERLGRGGHVTMPLEQQFFGLFGTLVDQFGVQWMFHYAEERPHGA